MQLNAVLHNAGAAAAIPGDIRDCKEEGALAALLYQVPLEDV